ncbi:Vesicle-associated protein 4-1 [Turnera subulata]|uniref:Vesicle-associated protein 4-1 n=1 Tax=Turnera subulata TaxID=218843 RepID=A0A9Q0J7M2_9ROSI|nr:Vesicle-associated protein 4-1 [Turnera subulata]
MAISDRRKPHGGGGDMKLFGLCPFWQPATNDSSSSSTQNLNGHGGNRHVPVKSGSMTVSSVARSLLPARRRLRLDPANNLYFPYEPGKQVRSAIRLKNTSRSHVAFKFQTTAPKSCYMRPPGAILAPGESLIATVFKFVEQPENNEKPMEQKSKVKFKIVSLKVKGGLEYVPELEQKKRILSLAMSSLALLIKFTGFVSLFLLYSYGEWSMLCLTVVITLEGALNEFDEQKDEVTVERILRVVFLDAERPSPALEKLKRQLAEAEAALEARKKPPPAESGPRVVGEGLVIDEWKERREKYLARQQVEAVDST